MASHNTWILHSSFFTFHLSHGFFTLPLNYKKNGLEKCLYLKRQAFFEAVVCSWPLWGLERQVVNLILGSSGWLGSRLCRSLGSRSKGATRHNARLGTNSCRINQAHVEGTDAVVPAALILVSIDIKRHSYFLACLYIETANAVGAKNIKHHLLRISVVSLEDIVLCFPLATCGYSASFWQNGNNLSL